MDLVPVMRVFHFVTINVMCACIIVTNCNDTSYALYVRARECVSLSESGRSETPMAGLGNFDFGKFWQKKSPEKSPELAVASVGRSGG